MLEKYAHFWDFLLQWISNAWNMEVGRLRSILQYKNSVKLQDWETYLVIG